MDWNTGSERIVDADCADAATGVVRWRAGKSLWIGSMTLAALVFGPLTFEPAAFLLFLASTALTLCAGHSVGLHRRLIHQSFECPRWLEYACVYLGTLVGMAPPAPPPLKMWTDREDYVIAESLPVVAGIMAEMIGYASAEEYLQEHEQMRRWKEVPMDRLVTLRLDEERREEKVAVFIAEFGRGHFASANE